MLELMLILASAAVYPALHLISGWLFSFAEITPHIALVYLPAFLRMLNILLLGKFRGTVATALGGLALMSVSGASGLNACINVACSAAGPLMALVLFEQYFRRNVNLLSLRDLSLVTLAYCMSNALVHHLMWSLLDPDQLVSRSQMLWMMLGDFNGTLIGAYLLKWTALRLEIGVQRGRS